MDRTVDLAEVLRRGDAALPAGEPGPSRGPTSPAQSRASAARPDPGPPDPPRERPSSFSGLLTVASLTAAWPDVVSRGKERGQLLGAVLEALTPVLVEGGAISVGVRADHGHMLEGARRQQAAIQEVLRSVIGQPVQVAIVSGPVATEVGKPKRLSEKELKDDKLRQLRTQDPTLDAAADALDLEIVE
jgi:hypothetical protein